MATYTSYLNLEKPTTSETFNLLKMNQNWDKIDAGVSALNSKLNDEPWLQSGNSYSTGTDWCTLPASLTSSQKRVEISLFLPKMIGFSKTVTITTLRGVLIKASGGNEHGDDVDYLALSGCTISPIFRNSNVLLIRMIFDTSLSAPNNSVLVFRGRVDFEVS